MGVMLRAVEEASAGTEEPALERARRSMKLFVDEIGEHLQRLPEELVQEPRSGEEASYQQLRQALASTQGRCATLNDDMLHLADDNEELVTTMQSMKKTNRKCIEQIQAQNEEIARMTQMRLDEEHKYETLTREYAQVEGRWKRDLDEDLKKAKALGDTAYEEKERELGGKLKRLLDGLKLAASQTAELRAAQQEARSEASAAMPKWREELNRKFQELRSRCAAQLQGDTEAAAAREHCADTLRARLVGEEQGRLREADTARQRAQELSEEGQGLVARSDAEAAHVRADVEATRATRESERAGAEQERKDRATRVHDLAVQAASLGAMLESARGASEALELQRSRSEAQKRRLDDELRGLVDSLRSSDEALDRALENNEGLLRQMEDQRLEAQRDCEEATRIHSEACRDSKAQMEAQSDFSAGELQRRVEEIEHALGTRTAAATRAQLAGSRAAAEKVALQTECTFWKAQEVLAGRLREEIEREFAELRGDWQEQLGTLEAQHEDATSKLASTRGECESCQAAASEFGRAAEPRLRGAREHGQGLERQVAALETELRVVKQAATEKVSALAAARGAAAVRSAAAVEARHKAEGQLKAVDQDMAQVRERLALEANRERQKAELATQDCELIRQESEVALEEARVRPSGELADLQRALSELQEQRHADGQQADGLVEGTKHQAEAREREVATLQAQLDEHEKLLRAQADDLKATRQRQGGDLRALKEQLAAAKERAAQASERELELAGRLHEEQRTASAEQARLQRELAELASLHEQQGLEVDLGRQALRKEHDRELALLQGRIRAEVDEAQSALDTAETDGVRLQRLAAAQLAGEQPELRADLGREPIAAPPAAGGSAASPYGSGYQPRNELQEMLGLMQRHFDQMHREGVSA